MSRLSEITDLLAAIASKIKPLDPSALKCEEDIDYELSISSLNRSLNLSSSNSRVLDTALSLMCFKAPQVFDSVIEYEVKTVVSILSSAVVCKVSRFQKEEICQIGSAVSRQDCLELIETCADVWEKLEVHGNLSHLLSYAVVRALVLSSSYQHSFPFIPVLDIKSSIGRSATISKLLCHLPREFSVKSNEIPSRLLLWYLDPQFLKQDVTKIMKETLERPFLYLSRELHERMDWRSIIICLALSPTMFIQARALLHNWFLLTGMVSVLDLLVELVSSILDVISRPSWWALSVEVGSNLPFSNTYFPYMHRLLRTFGGPISSASFLQLVHLIKSKHSDSTAKQAAVHIARVDHRSNWALSMSFPNWFLFASVLLFSEQGFSDIFHSKCTLGDPKTEHTGTAPSYLSSAAARYIAWILSPFSESHQNLVADSLTKISGSWALKLAGSHKRGAEESQYRKKLKKPRICMEDFTPAEDKNCQTIGLWLKEFQNMYTKSTHDLNTGHNVLFRRIPLGILINLSHCVNEDGCQLLLHYAATGIVLKPSETQTAGLKHKKPHPDGNEDSVTWSESRALKEAIAGASLVFNLTDIAERMSVSLFETEERGLDFVSQLKGRTGKYLVKCLKKLLELEIGGVVMLKDICCRLVRWRHQGREVFPSCEDLDGAINALNLRLSSL